MGQEMLDDETVESAARAYCKYMGLDPDEKVEATDKENPNRSNSFTRWELAARDVKRHAALSAAINQAFYP